MSKKKRRDRGRRRDSEPTSARSSDPGAPMAAAGGGAAMAAPMSTLTEAAPEPTAVAASAATTERSTAPDREEESLGGRDRRREGESGKVITLPIKAGPDRTPLPRPGAALALKEPDGSSASPAGAGPDLTPAPMKLQEEHFFSSETYNAHFGPEYEVGPVEREPLPKAIYFLAAMVVLAIVGAVGMFIKDRYEVQPISLARSDGTTERRAAERGRRDREAPPPLETEAAARAPAPPPEPSAPEPAAGAEPNPANPSEPSAEAPTEAEPSPAPTAEPTAAEPTAAEPTAAEPSPAVAPPTAAEAPAGATYEQLLAEGDAQSRRGRYRQASTKYEQAIALDARGDAALSALSMCYLNMNRMDDALTMSTRATEANPSNAQGWLVRGFVLQTKRRRDEARAAYQQCIEVGGTTTSARECRVALRSF